MYKNREGYRPIELCWSSRVLSRLRCEPIESMICALLLLGCRCRCCWSAVLQRCQRCTLFLSHTLRVVVVLGAIWFSFPVEHTSNWHWLDRFQLLFQYSLATFSSSGFHTASPKIRTTNHSLCFYLQTLKQNSSKRFMYAGSNTNTLFHEKGYYSIRLHAGTLFHSFSLPFRTLAFVVTNWTIRFHLNALNIRTVHPLALVDSLGLGLALWKAPRLLLVRALPCKFRNINSSLQWPTPLW